MITQDMLGSNFLVHIMIIVIDNIIIDDEDGGGGGGMSLANKLYTPVNRHINKNGQIIYY